MVPVKERLISLDAFRGITIAGMILVNNPGSWQHVYPPLLHAPWHGWTPTDLIFPFFLFVVGVAMTFSFATRLASTEALVKLYFQIVKRSLILFGLGLFLHLFPYFRFESMRIPGVLQRIAVVYLFASLITLRTSLKGQAWAVVILLLVYWALLTLVPVPGYGAGDLSVKGNLAAYIDNSLLHGHIWQPTWDPEGILSTVPAIATVLAGVLVGHLLRSGKEKNEIAEWMFVIGWGAILAGLIWHIWFPINKNLWTSSYVVFTAGAALQFLGVCYWLIDVKGWRTWAYPAIVFGMNAIAVFALSVLVTKLTLLIRVTSADGAKVTLKVWIYENLFVSWAGLVNGSLAFAVTNVIIFLGLMAILHRRKIFIKI